MVYHHRFNQLTRKVEAIDEESQAILVMDCSKYSGLYKRTRPKLISLILISLLSFTFVLTPHIFGSDSAFSLLFSPEYESGALSSSHPCSSVSDGTICCDRNSIRTDVCTMKGDVRTQSSSSSIFLYGSRDKNALTEQENDNNNKGETILQYEKVKPYTRKWETSVMNRIDELNLFKKRSSSDAEVDHKCEVNHNVPAVFFSTGGYTGNVYHEFNDGLLPLYITSQRFKRKVVFVILEYHDWWIMKYGDVLKRLSDYPPIDFSGDSRTHCFPEAVVGLEIHGELSVDPSPMRGNKTIVDFRKVLDRAYRPRIKDLIKEEKLAKKSLPFSSEIIEKTKKPELLIVSRKGSSRSITNEDLLVKIAEGVGFRVKVLVPQKTSEMAKIYRAMNSSDVMIGVHGAAMTHFLFMRPGSVFIQVVPLGTVWAAENYYGEPARKLGLNYVGYEIAAEESSLWDRYDRDDPVLRDPSSVSDKGWEFTKSIYLDGQNVRLDLVRFKRHLDDAYKYSLSRMTHNNS